MRLQFKRDLLKGTEIDLTFELSESREITVSTYFKWNGARVFSSI